MNFSESCESTKLFGAYISTPFSCGVFLKICAHHLTFWNEQEKDNTRTGRESKSSIMVGGTSTL